MEEKRNEFLKDAYLQYLQGRKRNNVVMIPKTSFQDWKEVREIMNYWQSEGCVRILQEGAEYGGIEFTNEGIGQAQKLI